MRNLLLTGLLFGLIVAAQPAYAADLRSDVRSLQIMVKSLQSQLRTQSRAEARMKSLESRLARMEKDDTSPRSKSFSTTVESRLSRLELGVRKLSVQVANLKQSSGGSAGGGSLETRLQKIENVVKVSGGNVTLEASGKVMLKGSTADVSASQLKVNTGMADFSGVVKSNTLITNSVVSSSYTPGAGNVW